MRPLITASILAIFFCGLTLQAAAAPQLSLGTATLSPGQSGTLTLALSGGAEPYAGLNAKVINLPAGVTVTGLAKGNLLSGSFLTDFRTFSDPQTGLTLIAYSGTETLRAANGVLLSLQLRASDTAPIGEYPVSFAATNLITAVNSRYALSNESGFQSITPAVSPGTIRIGSNEDADGDGLPDTWEQQIIDADPWDAITSIADVLPGDDFDGDGLTNLEEYEGNTDPTVIDFTIIPPGSVEARAGIDSIRISWEPNESAYVAGYNVYRSLSETGPFNVVNSELIDSAGNTYSDTLNLVDKTLYYYRVRAIDTSGLESAPSETVSAYFGLVKMFIKDQNGNQGATVTLPVSISNADNMQICGAEIEVTYDPNVLSATEVIETSLSMGYAFDHYIPNPGTVIAVVLSGPQGPTLYGEDALFEIIFDVTGDVGSTTQLQFKQDYSNIIDCTMAANLIPLDLSDTGVFTVSGTFIAGDLDGNGTVDEDDRTVMLAILTRKITPTENHLKAGDLNGDGKITLQDGGKLGFLIEGIQIQRSLNDKKREREIGGQVNVSIPNTLISAGERTWVPIMIDNAADIAAADIVLNYDSTRITAIDVRRTSMTQGHAFAYNLSQTGQVKIVLTSTSPIDSAHSEGPILEVQFEAHSDVFGCVSFPLTLAEVKLYDILARDLETSALKTTINTTNGSLTVRSDEVDSLSAALAVLKLLVGIEDDLCRMPPDINGDTKVDLIEAIYVLQNLAGMR